jgi:hypothetical protein
MAIPMAASTRASLLWIMLASFVNDLPRLKSKISCCDSNLSYPNHVNLSDTRDTRARQRSPKKLAEK